ncbi:hypothetical protein [Rhodobacter sp. SY28-1]|uniref:hypothetical protein n=1 Tax=Rhodobacter sp. SY28-1 TaxID=2562317 RepID=UPI0010BFDDF3|nr:hypothetical protein [Rhodobacter sp. SY28-1]
MGATVILMNDAALSLLSGREMGPEPVTVIIVGTSPVRMALAEVAFPDALLICADPGQSAALAVLDERLREIGRLDRLVLAGDGADSAAIFALMRMVVTFLPALRCGTDASIDLAVQPGPAVVALRQFLRRMQPTLDDNRIAVRLTVATTTSV